MYNKVMKRDSDINLKKLKHMLPDCFESAYMDSDGILKGYKYVSSYRELEYLNWKAKRSWDNHIRASQFKAQRHKDSLLRELDDESIMSISGRS